MKQHARLLLGQTRRRQHTRRTHRHGAHRNASLHFSQHERSEHHLDLTHRDKVFDAGLRIHSDTTMVGWRRSQAWAKDQIVYFALEFSQPLHVTRSEKSAKGTFRFDTRSGEADSGQRLEFPQLMSMAR